MSKGLKNENIVSSVDIYPTLSELCGLKVPDWVDGKSFIPLLQGKSENWNNTAYSYFRNGISMRTPDYRFTVYFRNNKKVYELYDHTKTDIESVNIAGEKPELIQQLLSGWAKGNTGLYEH